MPAEISVPIKLEDGNTYNMRFDWAACNRLEDELGTSVLQLGVPALTGGLGFKKVSKIIWVGMLHENPKLTYVDLLKNLLSVTKLVEYLKPIEKVLSGLFPEEKGGSKKRKGSSPEDALGENT